MIKSPAIDRIVFWEPSLSPHKIDLVRGLAALAPEIHVIYVADQEVPVDRQAMGWSVAANGINLVVGPSTASIDELVRSDPATSLHIFSGIRWVPSIVAAIEAVRRHHANFAIMSEPRATIGISGVFRYLHSWATEGWFRKNARFVLAIGRNGPPWFRRVGYPPSRIFPFAYFIPRPSSRQAETHEQKPAVNVGYVGRLVREKGVFDLIDALGIYGSANLTVVGNGSERDAMERRCTELGVVARFDGIRPIASIPDILREVDVLILASTTKDGWGAVVSEALLVGTAVIATPEVGASILLDVKGNGVIVPKKSPHSIARAVERLQCTGSFGAEARAARCHWAGGCLTGTAGAKYLLDINRWSENGGVRPEPFYNRSGHDLPYENSSRNFFR